MAKYELSDFTEDGHLKESCAPMFDGYTCLGDGVRNKDCAAHLYEVAKEALETAHRLQNEKIDLIHGPGASTALDAALADGSIFSQGD